MVTLKDIREYMVNSMSHYNPSDDDEDYDEDGHCGDGLWLSIQEFWNDFKTDADFKYLVSCEWASDDFDLEGGRSYLLDSKLVDMCFDYMYNTLGWSKNDYQNIIHNTVDFSEDLEDKYDNISVQRDERINSIIDIFTGPLQKPTDINQKISDFKKVTKLKCITTEFNHYASDDIIKVGEVYDIVDSSRCWEDHYKMIYINIGKSDKVERAEFSKESFEPYIEDRNKNVESGIDFDNRSSQDDFDYIPHVIKYHKSMEELLISCNSVEYLGKSRVDDNFFIYKIKSLGVRIPKGYEVVKSINEIMSN